MDSTPIDSRKRSNPPSPEKANEPKETHKPYVGANAEGMKITITKDGPYVVEGGVPLTQDAICESADGTYLEYHRVRDFSAQDSYALCRCGESTDKPFCDAMHVNAGYNDGSEAFGPGWSGTRDSLFKNMPDSICF